MAGILRNIIRKSLITLNIAAGISMLLLYALPYTNQDRFWMLNMMALVFPVLILIQLFFFVFWLIAKPRMALLPVFFAVLSYKLIFSFVAIQGSDKNNHSATAIKLLSWNVHLFNFFEKGGKPDPEMIRLVKARQADIFCAQELVFSLNPSSSFTLEKMKEKLGYRYVVAANDRAFGVHTNPQTKEERYHPFCVAIFSNHPIIQWKKVQTIPEYNHTFLWADILINKDTIRVFNIHLQSMYFAKDDYDFIENIDRQNVDQVSNHGKNILRKIKNANYLRALQILEVKKELLRSPHPVMLAGDFNDVPNSFAHRLISQVMIDAFMQKGSGIGRTFQKLSPTLRIDYIFSTPSLIINNFKVHPWNKGDHHAIEASVSFPVSE
jgi:endonuclease/exonuclease/phosphatase family metal-dependent hydrolase